MAMRCSCSEAGTRDRAVTSCKPVEQNSCRRLRSACWRGVRAPGSSGSAEAVSQTAILGGVICGDRRLSTWATSGKPQAPDYFQARGVLTRVVEALQLELSDRRLKDDARLHPGRAATLVLEGRPLGCFGQLHPAMAEELDLPEATYLLSLIHI